MRFLSPYPALSVLLRNGEERFLPNGRAISTTPPLTANFRQHDVLPHERDIGLKSFSFPGMPVQEDGLTPIDPSNRLAVFDTELQGWPEEDQKLAEETLMRLAGPEWILVEAPILPAPWPGYNSVKTARRVAELAEATGTDPQTVIAYERANRNRQEFIDALEALTPEEEPSEELVSA